MPVSAPSPEPAAKENAVPEKESAAPAAPAPVKPEPALEMAKKPDAGGTVTAAALPVAVADTDPLSKAEALFQAGDYEAAAKYCMQAGDPDACRRMGDALLAKGRYQAAGAFYEAAEDRRSLARLADALYAGGFLETAVGYYAKAGAENEKSRMARMVLDCQALFYAFRFSDAFIARLNAGKVDLKHRPSGSALEQVPELQELVRFFGYITRGGAPKLSPANLLLCREYFRAEAGRLFSPADGHVPTDLEGIRANFLVSQAAMANMAATLLTAWN